MYKKIFSILLFLCVCSGFSQPISLYKQFLGRYDFTMIGNTLNTAENSADPTCTILTQSAATLNLNANQTVTAAYLYWSGGILENNSIDLDVTLNGTPITAQRTFYRSVGIGVNITTGGFADVTNLVKATGNGTYLLSDFGVSINCNTTGYAGWAIVIVYEQPTLSGRMVNIYDGFEDFSDTAISITLSQMKLTDTEDAKVGFLVWEGDASIANNEYLKINNNVISNPPLNPADNIFNGTNSFTGSNTLYNMDLDYFDISNYVSVGDTSMKIEMSSGEVVFANAFAVTLINLIPDATIVINNINVTCDSRDVRVSYTVFNTNASEVLPANTPIAFYADGTLVGTTKTRNSIAIKGSEKGTVALTIPAVVDDDFVLTATVDDDGTGNGIVDEADEDNNTDTANVTLKFSPEINQPEDIIICDTDRRGTVSFDLASKRVEISTNPNVSINFYQSEEDALSNTNRITRVENYELESRNSQIIWVRATHPENDCVGITYFTITAQELPFTGLDEPLMLCNLKDQPLVVNLASAHLLLSRMFDYMNEIDLQFYETESDAENEVNEIINVENYRPVVFPQVVYIRTKGKNNLWCDVIIQMQLNDCIIPKGISPNSDGLNDGFDLAVFNLMELKIFNRYGTEVFEYGEGYTNQWSGQDKSGKILPAGTYYYAFKTLFDTYAGWVYVIREVK